MKHVCRIYWLIMLVALAGCAVQQPRPADAVAQNSPEALRQRVHAIQSHLNQYDIVVGRWTNGAMSTTYKAYFNDTALVYIVETASRQRSNGYAVNKYYYEAGSLFYYHGHGSVSSIRDMTLRPTELDVQIAFGPEGQPARKTKIAGGRQASVTQREMQAILRHAKILYRQSKALRQ